jgi:hypothetical protein
MHTHAKRMQVIDLGLEGRRLLRGQWARAENVDRS